MRALPGSAHVRSRRSAHAPSVDTICHAAPAVAFYEVVLALHIIAVVIAFGATFAYPVLLAAVTQGRPARAARAPPGRSTRSASA